MTKLLLILLILTTTLIGCSKKESDPNTTTNTTGSTYTNTNTHKTQPTFTLSSSPKHHSKYFPLANTIAFIDGNNNNKLSIANLDNYQISPTDIVDFFNFSAESITVISDIIYYTNLSDNKYIYSLDYEKNLNTKLSNMPAYNLISNDNSLYFINGTTQQLCKYNIQTNETQKLTSSRTGKFILADSYILFENIDDKSRLYTLDLSSNEIFKTTDFPVESFTVYDSTLLCINSIDNNSLYSINTNTYESKKIANIYGKSIKSDGSNLYFINKGKQDHLYSISLTDSGFNTKAILSDSINNYYLTEENIFFERKTDVNNSFFIKK